MSLFSNTNSNFIAGKISQYLDNWRNITSDTNILNLVRGYALEFNRYPNQNKIPKPINFSEAECKVIDEEIELLLKKKVIEIVQDNDDDEFISNIFVRPKKNGKFRVILNLKQVNEFIEYHHFKMETFKTALNCVSRNCFFASVDLQDAYYSCKVMENDRKYLRFIWNKTKYQYTCLAMGLASSPRIFTKLMKPVFSTLRKRGHANVAYIDDTLLISDNESECRTNVVVGQIRSNYKY